MPPPMGAPDMPAPPMMGGPPGMYMLWKNFFFYAITDTFHPCKFLWYMFKNKCDKNMKMGTLNKLLKKREKRHRYIWCILKQRNNFSERNPYTFIFFKRNVFDTFIRFPASIRKYSTPSLPSPWGYATYGDASSLSHPRRQ